MSEQDLFSDFGTTGANSVSSIFNLSYDNYLQFCKLAHFEPKTDITSRQIRNHYYQPTINKILNTWNNGDANEKNKSLQRYHAVSKIILNNRYICANSNNTLSLTGLQKKFIEAYKKIESTLK